MKLYSWNVNGIRAAEKKGFLDWLDQEQPEIVCIQETKAQVEQLSSSLIEDNSRFVIESPTINVESPASVISTFLSIWLTITSICLSSILTP